ncbi:MAG: hypothetical protein WAU91_04990 [Desulfatitalea sp.]
MERSQIVSVLNQYKAVNSAKYGIKRLGLFGSTARHTATDQRGRKNHPVAFSANSER